MFGWSLYTVKFAVHLGYRMIPKVGIRVRPPDWFADQLPRAAMFSVLLWAVIIEWLMYGMLAFRQLLYALFVTKYFICLLLYFQAVAQ
jgi:hypothetical protein